MERRHLSSVIQGKTDPSPKYYSVKSLFLLKSGILDFNGKKRYKSKKEKKKLEIKTKIK